MYPKRESKCENMHTHRRRAGVTASISQIHFLVSLRDLFEPMQIFLRVHATRGKKLQFHPDQEDEQHSREEANPQSQREKESLLPDFSHLILGTETNCRQPNQHHTQEIAQLTTGHHCDDEKIKKNSPHFPCTRS
mgnify:CR=1 FL=1